VGLVEDDNERRIAVADDWQLIQRLARSSLTDTTELRRLVRDTSVDHQSKLVQDPLWDVQPVQCSSVCKRGLCRHAVSVRLSVTFVYSVKTKKKHIFIFLSVG